MRAAQHALVLSVPCDSPFLPADLAGRLHAALGAHEALTAEGIRSRVVSMPSWDIFEHQSKEYRDRVLPPGVKTRLAVEQASTFGWERYVGDAGRVIGMGAVGGEAGRAGNL